MLFDALQSYFLAAPLGFLIGSIPFGLLLGYACGIGDIRKGGSGNIGATNMLRMGGKLLAFYTLIFDAGKGILAMYLAQTYLSQPEAFSFPIAYVAGFATILGHIYSPWLKCKGGKGVATSLGVLWMVDTLLGGFACLMWLAVFLVFRISSLSALIALILTPFFAYMSLSMNAVYLTALMSIVVIIRHKENIERLMHDEERKV